MSSQFHRVVEDPPNNQHIVVAAADQEVSWPVDRPTGRAGAAVRQMPRKDPVAQFRTGRPPNSVTARRRVSNSCSDQCLVALACFCSEPVVRPRENRNDVVLG